jgi:Holliday junction resolvase
MPSHSAGKTCFISSAAGTDLNPLIAALEGHGYAVVVPTQLGAGQRWLDALTESLKTVDLVVGVFGSGEAIANPVFEIGYALGIGKLVLAIVSPTAEDLPFALSSLPVVRAEPTDREAIEFALGSLPVHPLRHPAQPAPAAALPLSTDHLDEYTARIKGAQTERELLDVLRTLLVDAGVEVVADAHIGDHRADFAIWSDVLGTYVGNPLIVEVKRTLHTMDAVHQALAQLTHYLSASGAPWGLLLYVNGPDPARIAVEVQQATQVLALSLDELLERLRSRSFFDIIRDLRNRKVHGVDR